MQMRSDGSSGAIAIYICDGVESIDIGGSYGMFSMARRVIPNLGAFTVSETSRPVALSGGLPVLPDHDFAGCPPFARSWCAGAPAGKTSGVASRCSLSRPWVSDDNPFSEARFKTLKYHPGFSGRFDNITAATAFCRSFFPWYNTEHRHAGIAMLTPHDVHYGRSRRDLEQRERTLRPAWARHPERFVHGIPKPQSLPNKVWSDPLTAATTPPPA